MNILLLGNGFDLYHDLPTKYINFINTANFLKNYFDENTMNTIGEVFNDERLYNTDQLIKESYAKYGLAYSSVLLNPDDIKKLINIAHTNLWFAYMSSIASKIDTWIDFEKEIGIVIQVFEHFFQKNRRKELIFTGFTHEEIKTIDAFNFFYSKNIDDFIGTRSYIVNDFFLTPETISRSSCIDKDKIIKHLYSQLTELSDMLKIYLTYFVDNAVDKIEKMNLIKKCNFLSNMGAAFTLNYTHTFEKLYANPGTKHIYHIHGDLNSNIVLGLNSNDFDELENLNTDFLCFKKYYQRVFYKTDTPYLSAIKYDDVFDKRLTPHLFVFGHSLDITDKDIIIALFERSEKITIYCHSTNVIGTYIKNLVSIYGKKEFDNIRMTKELTFELLN